MNTNGRLRHKQSFGNNENWRHLLAVQTESSVAQNVTNDLREIDVGLMSNSMTTLALVRARCFEKDVGIDLRASLQSCNNMAQTCLPLVPQQLMPVAHARRRKR
jgi:hypothetical protein